MKRKPVESTRIPLNCLIDPTTRVLIDALKSETGQSQGAIIDQAVALLSHQQTEPAPARKVSKKDQAIAERAASDIAAQELGREDIDYSDVESTPTTHVANLKPQPAKPAPSAAIQHWRANRRPLPKPGDRT